MPFSPMNPNALPNAPRRLVRAESRPPRGNSRRAANRLPPPGPPPCHGHFPLVPFLVRRFSGMRKKTGLKRVGGLGIVGGVLGGGEAIRVILSNKEKKA